MRYRTIHSNTGTTHCESLPTYATTSCTQARVLSPALPGLARCKISVICVLLAASLTTAFVKRSARLTSRARLTASTSGIAIVTFSIYSHPIPAPFTSVYSSIYRIYFKHIFIKPGLNVFGDAFFNHDQILTPLPNYMIDGGTTNFGRTVVPRPGEKERKEYIDYNKDHSRGRIVVENVFSRLQRTWSVLGQPLRFRPDRRYKKLVVILCALWNRLCDTGVQKFPRDLKRTNHVHAWERKLHRESVRKGYDGFLNEDENVGLDYDSQDDEW
ncbi:hypothetical protein RI054_16g77190 [Pseudoscourfieldia marina]